MANLKWHSMKSVHPTTVWVYILSKLFLQGSKFCSGGKSENIMADQTKILPKKLYCLWMSDFQHAIPYIELKTRFTLFKPRNIHTYIICWGSHRCFTEKIQSEKWQLKDQIKNKFLSNFLHLLLPHCAISAILKESFLRMCTFTIILTGCTLFKVCHFKWAKAYFLCHELCNIHVEMQAYYSCKKIR